MRDTIGSPHGKEGRLVRQLRILQGLRFERAGGPCACLTLTNSRPGMLGLNLDLPSIGLVSVNITYHAGCTTWHVVRLPTWHRETRTSSLPAPLCVAGHDGADLHMTVVRAESDRVVATLDIPAVGTADVSFELGYDRAKLAILADRAIIILPT